MKKLFSLKIGVIAWLVLIGFTLTSPITYGAEPQPLQQLQESLNGVDGKDGLRSSLLHLKTNLQIFSEQLGLLKEKLTTIGITDEEERSDEEDNEEFYESLNKTPDEAATTIQKTFKGYQAKKQFKKQKAATITLQAHTRGFLARKKLAEEKKTAQVENEDEFFDAEEETDEDKKAKIKAEETKASHNPSDSSAESSGTFPALDDTKTLTDLRKTRSRGPKRHLPTLGNSKLISQFKTAQNDTLMILAEWKNSAKGKNDSINAKIIEKTITEEEKRSSIFKKFGLLFKNVKEAYNEICSPSNKEHIPTEYDATTNLDENLLEKLTKAITELNTAWSQFKTENPTK